MPASFIPPPDGSNVTYSVFEVADAAARLAIPQASAKGRNITQADDGSAWALRPNGLASNAEDWVCVSFGDVTNSKVNNAISQDALASRIALEVEPGCYITGIIAPAGFPSWLPQIENSDGKPAFSNGTAEDVYGTGNVYWSNFGSGLWRITDGDNNVIASSGADVPSPDMIEDWMLADDVEAVISIAVLVAGGSGSVPVASLHFPGALVKSSRSTVAFKVSGNGIATSQAFIVALPSGENVTIDPDSPAPLDTGEFVAGADYAIHCQESGELACSAAFTPPVGGVIIGGFHYAPCENTKMVAGSTEYYTPGTYFTRGSVATKVATTAFHFTLPGSDQEYKAAVAAGHTLPSGTTPAGKWGLYRLSVVTGGTISVTPAAGNFDTGYDSEALAIAALPSVTGISLGHVTVLGASSQAFVSGTDALKGGTGGNPAAETNFYPTAWPAPEINPYSLWDTNFRAACPDPRGMFLYAGREWIDIYLTNDNPQALGTSAFNAPIADGATKPVLPLTYGGNGTARAANYDWYTASEFAAGFGKSLPSVETMIGAALGSTFGAATVQEPAVTGLLVNGKLSGLITSRYGMIQASGAMWVWTSTKGSDNDKMALTGGTWTDGGSAGPRFIYWSRAAPSTPNSIGSRFRSDHLVS